MNLIRVAGGTRKQSGSTLSQAFTALHPSLPRTSCSSCNLGFLDSLLGPLSDPSPLPSADIFFYLTLVFSLLSSCSPGSLLLIFIVFGRLSYVLWSRLGAVSLTFFLTQSPLADLFHAFASFPPSYHLLLLVIFNASNRLLYSSFYSVFAIFLPPLLVYFLFVASCLHIAIFCFSVIHLQFHVFLHRDTLQSTVFTHSQSLSASCFSPHHFS